jgi:hypothetical protein
MTMHMIKKLLAPVLAALCAASIVAIAANLSVDDIIAGGTTASVGSCGTSPAITGTDLAGVVTVGTPGGTGCVITFSGTKAAAPKCVVTWQTNIASMIYTVSTTAITITQTATSGNKINYVCVQ